jgi:hypothetical protein
MAHTRSELDAAILAELKARVVILRSKPHEELAGLPDANTDETEILGNRIRFSVFRQVQADGSLLILVRSDKPIFFGIGSAGTTEGFWSMPSGQTKEAYGDEIGEFFG